jgi:hypothetical protein
MSGTSVYVQRCPVCGRLVEVRVKHIGRMVNCHHCRGAFIACDSAQPASVPLIERDAMQRAEALIDLFDSYSRPDRI